MNVLIAIDHHDSSQAIIDALVKMRWFEGTELHVITVLGDDESHLPQIEDLAVGLHDALPLCEVFFIPHKGDPAHTILDAAKQIRAEMIVIGSNCKNTLESLVVGSVCRTVLRNAHIPVVVAKTPCCLAREASPGFKNILIPIDNSIFSDVAIRWLTNFAWAPDCRFILAAAVEEDTDGFQVQTSLRARALYLTQLLGTQNVGMEIVVDDPKSAILNLAAKHYSDLIVIGSHGRTGLQKLVLGNVASKVTYEAPCAVAVVRGIADDDHNWNDTGAFGKVVPVSVKAMVASAPRNRYRSDDVPHVIPGGM